MDKNRIIEMLESTEKTCKKSITLNLNTDLLQDVDNISKAFSVINTSKNFSRNSILETAIEEFVIASKEVFLNKYKIDIANIEFVQAKEEPSAFDLVVFPAHDDGFINEFLNENKWDSVRLKDEKIKHIKYVACYRMSPIQAITHYAKVESIKASPIKPSKKLIMFDGCPVELSSPIVLGRANANSMRSPRYTTLEKLIHSKEISDLF